ncbi:hypothetical protein [Haloarchaeobius litoreus]|uniref:Uncharacterized protein n=1 Tax=Haloarchaeobius litoreus TaxID=755306 RepID=A0ABD6DJP1_9EURY|nr:hypothetical protein [Haloarchaeobius litoreus]
MNPHRRTLTTLAIGLAATTLVPTASAHEGTVHGGTPHLLLLGTLFVGVALLAWVAWLDRTGQRPDPRTSAGLLVVGVSLSALATVGLVEIQVEPLSTTPLPRQFYPVLTVFGGMALALGSVLAYQLRWGDRHAYPVLGTVLGFWVAYPALLPGDASRNPLGYLLVLAVPALLGYVHWTELRPALARVDTRGRLVGSVAAVAFAGFFALSSGLATFNPDPVPQAGGEPFAVLTTFVSPLVSWPAIEVYRPGVPLFAALSVGTGITLAILAGLVGINAALGTTVWRTAGDDHDDGRAAATDGGTVTGVSGALATTGATACCCCGPALYGIASAALGASASPLYWAFTDPESPLATLFLVAAIGLLTASSVTLASTVRATCAR